MTIISVHFFFNDFFLKLKNVFIYLYPERVKQTFPVGKIPNFLLI